MKEGLDTSVASLKDMVERLKGMEATAKSGGTVNRMEVDALRRKCREELRYAETDAKGLARAVRRMEEDTRFGARELEERRKYTRSVRELLASYRGFVNSKSISSLGQASVGLGGSDAGAGASASAIRQRQVRRASWMMGWHGGPCTVADGTLRWMGHVIWSLLVW